MVEVVGDIVEPSTLIIPSPITNIQMVSGALFMSGSNLWFYSGLSGATQIQSAVTD